MTDVRCDSGGAARLRGFDTSVDPLGRGSSWIRLERDGRLMRLDFPGAFSGMVFTESEAIGVEQDRWGVQRLVRWSLPPRGA